MQWEAAELDRQEVLAKTVIQWVEMKREMDLNASAAASDVFGWPREEENEDSAFCESERGVRVCAFTQYTGESGFRGKAHAATIVLST